MPKLDQADLDWIEESGREPEEVSRQLRRLRSGRRFQRLARPCTVQDGLLRLDASEHEALERRWAEAAAEGRLSAFVPASGAASRMFAGLVRLREEGPGHPDLAWAQDVVERADQLAAWPLVEQALQEHEGTVLDALLEPWGLGGPELPKGLIPFHAYPWGSRTAFQEHLAEAEGLVQDAQGRVRMHLTVSTEHRGAFGKHLQQVRRGRDLRVVFTHQAPATDAICVDLDGNPLRDDQGRLLFRPAGHGSLLCNLAACEGDVILVKNIDNVVPQDRREALIWPWRRRLVGLLLRVQERLHELAAAVRRGESLDEARDYLARTFGRALPGDARDPASWLLDHLQRPLRVAAMVPSTGEPGGGPFFLADGTAQIIESAQVDHDDPEQEAIWRSSTHFNPVDMVLCARDHRGRPLDLGTFRDPEAVIITRKTVNGQPAWVYENPGLWNGAMAGWNSLFVEIPLECFAPVKTLADLLRPAHQPSP